MSFKNLVTIIASLTIAMFLMSCGDTGTDVDQCIKYCDMNKKCDTSGVYDEARLNSCKTACEKAGEADFEFAVSDDLLNCANTDDCTEYSNCVIGFTSNKN